MAIITFLKNIPTENQAVKIFGINYQIICLSPDYVRVGEVSQINEKPASGILCMTTPPAAHITLDMTENEVAELDRLSNEIIRIIIEDHENEKTYYIDNPILIQKEDVVDGKIRYCFDSINVEKKVKKYKACDFEKLLLQRADAKDLETFFVLKKKSYKLSAGKNAKFIVPTKKAYSGQDPSDIDEATIISEQHKYRILSIDPSVNDIDLSGPVTYLVDWEEADEISSKIFEPDWYEITLSGAEENAGWRLRCYAQKTTTFSDIPAELKTGDILKYLHCFQSEIYNPKERAELYSTHLAGFWEVTKVKSVERPIHGYPILTNWTYQSRGKQDKTETKYLRLRCQQVNEWNKPYIDGQLEFFYLPISVSEQKNITATLLNKSYIQVRLANKERNKEICQHVYKIISIDNKLYDQSDNDILNNLISSYELCGREYIWLLCDDETGQYTNVLFSIGTKKYQDLIKNYDEKFLKVNDKIEILECSFRNDTPPLKSPIYQNKWIVKSIFREGNYPMSFCCIGRYVDYSAVERHSKVNESKDNCDEESIFLNAEDLKDSLLTIDKDDLYYLTNDATLIQSNTITSHTESITTTEPLNPKKEDKPMKMNMKEIFGDTIGKYTSGTIKYSPSGLAFLTDNDSYVVYNVDTLAATDVANLVMDVPVYGIPVALKDLKKGDTIVHNEAYYLVKAITDTHISAINVRKGTIENLIPKTSIFGFSFYVKLVTPMETFKPDPSNPFNSMLPFLIFEDGGNDNSMKDIMMMSMMCGGTTNSSILPLIMMMNKDGGDKNDLLMMMMLMGNNPFAPKAPTPTPTSSWTSQEVPLNFPLDKGFMENE